MGWLLDLIMHECLVTTREELGGGDVRASLRYVVRDCGAYARGNRASGHLRAHRSGRSMRIVGSGNAG